MSPVLVAIDDAQWLDTASAAALDYALRRVEGERVGLLVATRPRQPGRRRRLEPVAAEVIRVGGLSPAAVHELVKERHGISLPRRLLLRLHQLCDGNPFYALEVARELVGSRLGPTDPLPVPDEVRQVVRRRVARLSPAAPELLLVAAAASVPTRTLIAAAVGGDSTPALEEAENAGVIAVDGERIRFTHPLYAGAVYGAAPPARRVAVHGQLANVVSETEERARHLAIATGGPSAAVAAELERAAADLRRRGAAVSAGTLLLEAARLMPPQGAAGPSRLELDAAQALFDGADTEEAQEILLRLVEEMTPGPDRARALLLLGLINSYDGEHTAATGACSRAELRRRGRDVSLRETILMRSDETVFCLFDGVEADVRAAGELAGIRFERVLESVWVAG